MGEDLVNEGEDVRIVDTVDLSPAAAVDGEKAGQAKLRRLLADGGHGGAPARSASVLTSYSSRDRSQTRWSLVAIQASTSAGTRAMWHGLGKFLADYPGSWDEARQLAGLDWDPIEFRGRILAVSEILAADLPEMIVINKADALSRTPAPTSWTRCASALRSTR